MQFIDECTVEVKAGNGGNGVVSWRKEAHNPYGGPYGGDGGDGGDVIFVGDINTNTLMPLRNHKIIAAENGENGKTKIASGKKGKDVYVKVPLGSVVYNANDNSKIGELLKHDEKLVVCHGGKGGHGNWWFKNPENKIPNLHENGDIGKAIKVKIELKYMADVGLVGLPNAGKSTFVSATTGASPKIANYQFTTLTPILGICEYKAKKLVFADIPGLIEGASQGKGLGHEFLRHIERCSILIHMISANPADNYDIIEAYNTIINELKYYSDELANKPIITVINKIDTPSSEENVKILKKYLKDKCVYEISALKKKNLDELIDTIFKNFDLYQKQKQTDAFEEKVKVYEVVKKPDYSLDLKINQVDEHTWSIESEYLKYWSNRIPLDTQDNIMRYNDKLKNIKLEDKVKQKGGHVGDTLLIYGNEMVLE